MAYRILKTDFVLTNDILKAQRALWRHRAKAILHNVNERFSALQYSTRPQFTTGNAEQVFYGIQTELVSVYSTAFKVQLCKFYASLYGRLIYLQKKTHCIVVSNGVNIYILTSSGGRELLDRKYTERFFDAQLSLVLR